MSKNRMPLFINKYKLLNKYLQMWVQPDALMTGCATDRLMQPQRYI